MLWEGSDRICGKRLEALLPLLVEAMERHGHLQLAEGVRTQLLAMSASTIDRQLQLVREQAFGGHKKRSSATNRVRKMVAVRTFADWEEQLRPGFMGAKDSRFPESRSYVFCVADLYEGSRTHLALAKDAPVPRAVEQPENGRIEAISQVGGLHHRYQRRAA